MKPTRLDAAVARATGESVRRIRRIGFSVVLVPLADRPPRPDARPGTGRTRKGG